MTWRKDAPYIPEVRKCRSRLLQYCRGNGLDLGCGTERISETAIGVDVQAAATGAGILADFSRGLPFFASNSLDYVFSAHVLQQLPDYVDALYEWWRLVKPGGCLVLYLPHKDHHPNDPEAGGDIEQRHFLTPEMILDAVRMFGSFEQVENSLHVEGDEYSFDLVLRKIGGTPGIDRAPGPLPPSPRALVIRYGGFGDHIIIGPVFRLLKEKGFDVTFNCNPAGELIHRYNPHIDHFYCQEMDAVPNEELPAYWDGFTRDYDRIINFSGSLEDALLKAKEDPAYKLSHEERNGLYGKYNYYDAAMEWAGFQDVKGTRGEIHFSEREELSARIFRKNFRNRFMVVFALAGSATHKTFPYYQQLIEGFVKKYPKALFITVGGYRERLLEAALPDCPWILKTCGTWDFRNTMAACSIADLVIAGQTGTIAAAGCFTTPKLCFLTHSSHENLCKTWLGDYSVQSRAKCSPCHKLIRSRDECEMNETYRVSVCAEEFDPVDVIKRMEEVYRLWDRNSTRIDRVLRPVRMIQKPGR